MDVERHGLGDPEVLADARVDVKIASLDKNVISRFMVESSQRDGAKAQLQGPMKSCMEDLAIVRPISDHFFEVDARKFDDYRGLATPRYAVFGSPVAQSFLPPRRPRRWPAWRQTVMSCRCGLPAATAGRGHRAVRRRTEPVALRMRTSDWEVRCRSRWFRPHRGFCDRGGSASSTSSLAYSAVSRRRCPHYR